MPLRLRVEKENVVYLYTADKNSDMKFVGILMELENIILSETIYTLYQPRIYVFYVNSRD